MVPSTRQARTLARGLGWFSIALGAAELLAARRMSGAVGLPGRDGLVRAWGVREIATGVGLLRSRRPAPWMWGRVGGDVLDLATLIPGLDDRRARSRTGAGVALAAVAAVTAVDLACARSLSRRAGLRTFDYSHRSGWSRSPQEMRGAALVDFQPPRDMQIPESLRPWNSQRDMQRVSGDADESDGTDPKSRNGSHGPCGSPDGATGKAPGDGS